MDPKDHRKIGLEQDYFSNQEDAGPGLVFWHPRLGIVRKEIEDFWWELHRKGKYQPIYSPHLFKEQLFKVSGHLEKFSEMMFPPLELDNHSYRAKPMNCPGHVLIYKNRNRSYRELPMRWAEIGMVYRYEHSGAVQGMMRARGFSQDDAHIFCSEQQLQSEIADVLRLIDKVLVKFGFKYQAYLATRPAGMSIGSDEVWEKSIESLKQAANDVGMSLKPDEGGGAFYGPKIDFKILDANAKEWQLSTVQCDFNLPERFDLKYIDSDGQLKHPIMVHRAIFGSFERFVGILIEHYNGEFPFWMAPEQFSIITIQPELAEQAVDIVQRLEEEDFRVQLMDSSEDMRKNLATSFDRKIPFSILLGKRDLAQNKVTLKNLRSGENKSMSLEEIIDFAKGLRKSRG